jgi:uncharacterized membrane protein
MSKRDSSSKTLAKTISWEIFHMIVVAGILYAFTGEWEYAGLGAILYVTLESLGYYVHERIWVRFNWFSKKK